jgi:hypothetical protein
VSVIGEQNVEAEQGQAVPGAQTVGEGAGAAPGGWFDCAVNLVGPAEAGVIYIHLRENNGQFDRWYQAYDAVKKEMLATALSAISTGLRVSVYLTTTDEYGTINRLYVHR